MRRSSAAFSCVLILSGCLQTPAAPEDSGDDAPDGAGGTSATGSDVATAGTTRSDPGSSTGPGATGSGGDGGSTGSDGGEGYSPDVLDDLDLPFPPANYAELDLPAHFLVPSVVQRQNTPPDNPVTDDGATLGRVLFHDVALSANQTTSCASCHRQDVGFTDDAQLSSGFEGLPTGRNSMHLANASYYASGRFFWDERAATLEEQVLMPIQDEVEMGLTLSELVEGVGSQPYYPELFARAFGDESVTSERIALALAQYVRSIVSYQSRYDVGLAVMGTPALDFPNFTEQENLGKDLFFSPRTRCAACHVGNPPPGPGAPGPQAAIFTPITAINNGLDVDTSDDEGAGGGAFKSPSMRNVALSGPFMHDGRFATLAEVVEHYDSGVQSHPNLDPRLQDADGQPLRMGLSELERRAIVAFMETLTDEALLGDPNFSDPFR